MRSFLFGILAHFFCVACSAQLPPAMQMRIYDSTRCAGYYIFSAQKFRADKSPSVSWQTILDGNGSLIYSRADVTCADFKQHEDGRFSFCRDGRIYLMNRSLQICDSFVSVNGVSEYHHDFKILPNGHYLLVGVRADTADLSSLYMFRRKSAAGSRHAIVKYDVIQELDEKKNVVFQWDAESEFSVNNALPLYLVDTLNISMPHINSVATDASGNIIASCRFYNQIIKIDRSTGHLLWRLGGTQNQFTFLNGARQFLGQHDAHYLANGNLLFYDNGYDFDSLKRGAAAVEFRIDEFRKCVELMWMNTFADTLTSGGGGNACRLSGNRTLMCFGVIQDHLPNLLCAAADEKGQPIFDISYPDTLHSYRAFGYDRLRINIRRPVVRIKHRGGKTYLTVKGGDSRTVWSNGATGAETEVKSPGSYQAAIPYDCNSFLWSENACITARDIR